ncbi:MAG: prepilin-type N-terminal cleavage/methylation domain-containing protein [Clostridia bacterium]|nr:prepilin-type N-terminal cleavage/methylation domain-containing protein [Clostridia bacterium]
MMTKSIRNDNRGLTLVELIVGVVILAIIVTPLLHALVTGASSAKKSKQYNDATLAAQNIIEHIEATDMEEFLGNAEKNNGKYVLTQTANSGGTDFDAKLIITPQEGDITVSNSMDAVFQVQAVDGTAYALFEAAGDETTSDLKRYITIDVTALDASTCSVTVTFDYSGTAQDTYLDGDGNTRYETISFSKKITSTMNVSPLSTDGSAFSVFLFFSAYFGTDSDALNPYDINMGRTTVNNNTTYDFNVFLIDTVDHMQTPIIKHEVDSKVYIKNGDEYPMVNLLTNMEVTYKVYRSAGSIWQTPQEVEPGLVENESIDRIFNITVEIYKKGTDTRVCSMDTVKLDYSTQ